YLISSGGLHFKLHACAAMTQPAADALLDALSKHTITPDQIKSIDVQVSERGTRLSADPQPTNRVAATASIPYVLSAILTFPDDVARDPYFTELYEDDKFHHQGRHQLAQKIHVTGSEEIQHAFEREWPMKFASHLDIHLTTGETIAGDAEIWSVS